MQGFNMGRYVPPDQEGLTSANKLAGKHPLGARARHLHTTGALIVRFEMPFAIWCTNCKPNETIIGQGVRFNAEKKKIGNYYSTPIYSFRMKHTTCGGWIEIHTDPKNTAYVVVEGARKRDTGEDKELQPGEILIRHHTQDPAEKDPFAKLEGKIEDKQRAQTESTRILELQRQQDRDWENPYEKSKRLRRTFRGERKGLEKLEANREALQDKMSLGIDLVDETDEDRQRAGMVDFGNDQSTAAKEAARATRVRPMFESMDAKRSQGSEKRDKERKMSRRAREAELVEQRKANFRTELRQNTRATMDPFLQALGDGPDIWKPAVKRKKYSTTMVPRTTSKNAMDVQIKESTDTEGSPVSPQATTDSDIAPAPVAPAAQAMRALVEYDSDTE